MPSGLQVFSESPFQGSGSKTVAVEYVIMCARVVGEATGDEQCLMIADGLEEMTGSSGRPVKNPENQLQNALDGGVSPASPAPSGGPGAPTMAPGGLVGV